MENKILKYIILEKIRRIMHMDYINDDECTKLILDVKQYFSDPNVLDYIDEADISVCSPEDIMDKALKYKPICLPDLS